MTASRWLLSLLFVPLAAFSQVAPTRTWPELSEAVQDRVNRNAYPLTGYDKEEVHEVLSRIKSLDRDDWARSWMQQGDKHVAAAKAAGADKAKAREAYIAAWRYYGFGAWPTQNSDGKRESHRRATAAFRSYATLAEPAIEVLRVPFEGKEITAYLQVPAINPVNYKLVVSYLYFDGSRVSFDGVRSHSKHSLYRGENLALPF